LAPTDSGGDDARLLPQVLTPTAQFDLLDSGDRTTIDSGESWF
jgi:hypothetical protein